ncbi:MAG: XdhC family protein [Candidatus Sumerlaeaceae bacterium]
MPLFTIVKHDAPLVQQIPHSVYIEPMSGKVLEAAAELVRLGRRGAMITIVETVGSTPRKAGAKMLVDDSGSITGTVGGGCVEADLYALARQVMRTGRVEVREVDLTARSQDDNDMLCGGKLKALIEPVGTEEKLIIFGGGHISKALVELCQALDFEITVTDDREQFANAERFPTVQNRLAMPFEEQFQSLAVDPNTSIVIVTRGHSYDEFCMQQALRTSAKYIGLVGSRTKVAVFRSHLREKGFNDAEIARVECPCGVDIGAETPEEIAVSIAARLIQVRRAMGLSQST